MAERDEYDDNDGNDGDSNESPLVKDLRKQLRAAKRDLTQRDEKIVELTKGTRERSVKDVLNAKGVRPGIAKWIPEDITSEEDITKWLESNAEDLGIDLEAGSQDGEPDPTSQSRDRAQSLTNRGVAPQKMADLEARMAKAESDDEIAAILAEARQFVM